MSDTPPAAPAGAAASGQVEATAAEVYDRFFLPALFERWATPMLDAAAIDAGDHVLDVGCGTGVLAKRAATVTGRSGRVVGLDPNPGMLVVARRTSGIEWTDGAAEAIPFGDATFDAVVSQFAIMFFSNRGAAISEMARVLKARGRIAIASWVSLADSPGYAAMAAVLDRVLGADAAAALGAPFSLGDEDELAGLLTAARLDDVDVQRHQGHARFDSIEAWVHTEIRGWTLSGMSDDDYARLLAAAHTDLAEFTAGDGTVEFAQPALIATGRTRHST